MGEKEKIDFEVQEKPPKIDRSQRMLTRRLEAGEISSAFFVSMHGWVDVVRLTSHLEVRELSP
jgi:hypothetical protein